MSSGLPSTCSRSARLETSRALATMSSFVPRPQATRPSTTDTHTSALSVAIIGHLPEHRTAHRLADVGRDRRAVQGISSERSRTERSGGANMAGPAKPRSSKRPEAAAPAAGKGPTLPYTGKELLASLDDDREVWIYGERVKNITTHPAFQNCARMLARLYDALHEDHTSGKNVLTGPTEWGGFTHRYFRAPRTVEEQVAGRDAIAAWARITYGWLGRSPDYKAAFLGTLGANAEFYAPYQENARRWYRFAQERVPFINHAIIHPPVDRNMAPGAAGGPTDLYAHVTKETDAGIHVSGAKVVATGSALTHFTFVAHHGLIPVQGRNFAVVFMVPTNAKGVKLICRVSNEMAKTADPWTGGCILPGMEPAAAYQVLAPEAYVQVKNLIEKTVASGLIYLNSHARDFKTADLRKYLDLYLRGSGGVDAVGRVKLMKLLWDAIGSEFGGRHELYEINYSRSHEEIRRYALLGALASGQYERWKQVAETCMAEYDTDGWKAKDLINVSGLSTPR